MRVRLATFNVENLSSWSEGQETLNDYNALNSLLNKETYSEEDKKMEIIR